MYWGSVRFYKQLIILVLALVLILPTTFAVRLCVENNRISKELEKAKTDNFANFILMNQNQTEYAWQSTNPETNDPNHEYEFDLEYQNLYPELYVGNIPVTVREPDAVYLTFDDGPSDLTGKILDVLMDKDVKATFFVIGKYLESEKGKNLLKRIAEEGHAIGIHSYSHEYREIYGSVENFLDDFYLTYNLISDITGKAPEIFRFPGGSINGYSSTIYKELIAEMIRRGFVYYDWNVSSQDAALHTSVRQIYNSVCLGTKQKTRSIILMHDSYDKGNTLKALPQIIDTLFDNGYYFKTLTRDVAPVIFGYSD